VIGVWKILAEPPLACTIAGDREFFYRTFPYKFLDLGGRLQELGRAKRLKLFLLLLLGSLKEPRKPSKGVGEEGERELQPGGGRPFIAEKWAVYAAQNFFMKLKTLVEEKRGSKLK
jgi:hypothetical protein